MINLQDPRWRNTSGYESFNCPLRAIAVAILSVAITNYAMFGLRWHRQRCRLGRDWVRFVPRKKGGYYNKVPVVYCDLRSKVEWIYSLQFGLICEVVELELELMQEFFLILLSGGLL